MLCDTITQIEIDEALIRNTGFLCHFVEILNGSVSRALKQKWFFEISFSKIRILSSGCTFGIETGFLSGGFTRRDDSNGLPFVRAQGRVA